MLTFVSLLLFAVPVLDVAYASPAGNPDENSPMDLVATTTEKVLIRIKDEREALKNNPHKVYTLVEDIVLSHFDFQRMSKWVLGKHWRRATPEQKQRFPEEFRGLLVRAYATALTEYTNEKINYLSSRMQPSGEEATVRTEIVRAAGPSIPVSYQLHLQQGKWKIYDINIDGISLVATYRSSFSTQIKRNGGLEALIRTLAARNKSAQLASK